MNVLLIGSGGREHAIAWKIAQSTLLSTLYISPGNAGTADVGINILLDIADIVQVKQFIKDKEISLVIVGPEAPLVNGFHDKFLADDYLKHIPVIGPTKKGAMLEGSKDFANKFMEKYQIPTAAFKTFDKSNLNEGLLYLENHNPPYVLKADGLASGKGVIISSSLNQAKEAFREMIEEEKFGEASKKVVIEEFLSGIELSVFVLTDGKDYKILPTAKDYKRIGEGDTGLNTGGMGSISPVPFADASFMQKVEHRIIKPTIRGLQSEGIEYRGFIFFGLINVNGDPFVIEYNVRMGDPEAESVIPRIQSDLLDLFIGVATGTIAEKELLVDNKFTAAVFLVSGGYPGKYENGKTITGLDKIDNSLVFHAGTRMDKNTTKTLTNGGRVIAICSYGNTMQEALEKSYVNAKKIDFEGRYMRSDLGFDLVSY